MTKRSRGNIGEAVMLAIMGAMVVGGIVVWLATGHFHMMPMHGEKHTEEKHMKKETVSSGPHDAHAGHATSRPEERGRAAGQHDTEKNKDFRVVTIISE